MDNIEQRPLGKDYRAWMRDHTADELVFAPIADVIRLACEDEPYNNRQGTWPQIIKNWLPFVLDNRQYKQGYALIDAAFRYTNAVKDQKSWSTTIMHLPTSVRRIVFKSAADLLVEAMRTSARGKINLTANMQGLFNEPAWVDPKWLDKWTTPQVMNVMLHTGSLKDVSGALFQLWLKPKAEQQHRFHQWIECVQATESQAPSYGLELLDLLPNAWKNQLYDSSVGKFFFDALTDPQLLHVTQSLNTHLSLKSAPQPIKDVVTQWLLRPHSDQNWLTALVQEAQHETQELSVLGKVFESWLENWNKVSKEARWTQKERQTVLVCAAIQPAIAQDEMIKMLLKKEQFSPGILCIIQSLDATEWTTVSSLLNSTNDALPLPLTVHHFE